MITPASTAQSTRQAVDDLATSADHAIDSSRNYANHAIDAAEDRVHNLRSTVQPALEKLSRRAGEYAHQGMDMATQAKDKARESLSQYSAATGRYVANKPIQSVLIAAAVGAAVALMISSARNRNRY